MSLGAAANWAQLIDTVPLVGLAVGVYVHHKCSGCWRPVLGHHGRQGRPACRRHA